MTMTAIGITVKTILAICGGISIIGGAGVVLHRWSNPAINLKNKVNELDNRCEELSNNLEELTTNTQCLCKCVLALMDSIISGNNVDNLKAVKGELQEFMITK